MSRCHAATQLFYYDEGLQIKTSPKQLLDCTEVRVLCYRKQSEHNAFEGPDMRLTLCIRHTWLLGQGIRTMQQQSALCGIDHLR
jgi:hypothetical protein